MKSVLVFDHFLISKIFLLVMFEIVLISLTHISRFCHKHRGMKIQENTQAFLIKVVFVSRQNKSALNLPIDSFQSQSSSFCNLVMIFFTKTTTSINTFKCHVFAEMGRFQLELNLIYLYFSPSFHQIVVVSVLQTLRCYNISSAGLVGC